MSHATDAADREIVITRLFDAPRERVWNAWADPKQVVKWWGPRGFSTASEQREFKPGGAWRNVMTGPDGTKYPSLARFEEIIEPERVVYTNCWGRSGGPRAGYRTTATFKDVGGKTELTMRVVFDTAEARELAVKEYGAIEGGKQSMARLEEHLSGEFVLSRLFDAPRALLWKAWTEPERLAAWFDPAGREILPGRWIFRETVDSERLVFVVSLADEKREKARHPAGANWPLEILSTILFEEMGGKTLLTIKCSVLDAAEIARMTFDEAREGMAAGWTRSLEKLDELLAKWEDRRHENAQDRRRTRRRRGHRRARAGRGQAERVSRRAEDRR